MSTRYLRKVIHIAAEDSPNVRRGMMYVKQGLTPPENEIILPGVLPYAEYKVRRRTWDKIRQTIGLDGKFYEGQEVLLYPPLWLDRAERLAISLRGQPRKAISIGIDPGEGVANTAMVAIDERGIIDLVSKPTPDTDVIVRECISFFRDKHAVHPEKVLMDRGGGGKQHADRLRAMGYAVKTIAFGETINLEPKRGMRRIEEKKENIEERYVYPTRRAQMYGDLRDLLNPEGEGEGFAIPPWYPQFRNQMSPIPLLYDGEGRLYLPPKNKKPNLVSQPKTRTLIDIIGHSPDELDALVLAVHGMLYVQVRPTVTGF